MAEIRGEHRRVVTVVASMRRVVDRFAGAVGLFGGLVAMVTACGGPMEVASGAPPPPPDVCVGLPSPTTIPAADPRPTPPTLGTAPVATRLHDDDAQQEWPVVYEDRVVWSDNRSGSWDIFLLDLTTGQERQITTDSGDDQFPDLWGDFIVYQSDRNGGSDVYLFDLNTGIEERISDGTGIDINPRLHDDLVVYESRVGGQPSVRRFNRATGGTATLAREAAQPEVSAEWVVWAGLVSGTLEVFAMNRANSCVHRVTTSAGAQRPAVGTTHVAFEVRSTTDEAPLDVVSLETGARTRLSPYRTFNADVSGSTVVWSDRRYDDPTTQVRELEILSFDLLSGTERALTADAFAQITPSIWGGRVVWSGIESQDINDDLDVYVLDLEP